MSYDQDVFFPGGGGQAFDNDVFKVDAKKPEPPPQRKRGSDAYERGRGMDTSPAGAAMQGLLAALQGPTFNFADELGGLVGGGLSAIRGQGFRPGYESVRDFMRGAADERQTQAPWTTGITTGMAGAAAGLGSIPIKVGGQALSRGAALLGNAVLFGGLSGAGSSTAEDIGGVANDAAVGAATNAAMAGGAAAAAPVLGAVGRQVASRVAPGQAQRYADQKIAEALLRDAHSGTPGNRVAQNAADELARIGQEGRLVDVGGKSTLRLLDTMATAPGQTAQAVEAANRARIVSRADRMAGAADSSLGIVGDRASKAVADLTAAQQKNAGPLYDEMRKFTLAPTDELRSIIEAARNVGADKEALFISAARRTPLTLDSPVGVKMGDIDRLKQGLDTLIAKNTDISGKLLPTGAAVQALKRELVEYADKATGGAYAAARNAYAGPAALKAAAEDGRKFMRMDDAALQDKLADMTTSERDMFRLGMFEQLRAKAMSPNGQTELMKLWRNQGMQEKLKVVFPSEASFKQFAAKMEDEAKMSALSRVGSGSQTAERMQGLIDADVSPMVAAGRTAAAAARGNWLEAALSGAQRAGGRLMTPEPVRNAIGQGLLGRQLTPGLRNELDQVYAAQLRNAGLVGMMPATAGLLGIQ